MRGTLYGVGVGPGDPQLLTLKAYRCIQESDVIFLPSGPKEDCHAYRIIRESYPQIVEKETICLEFPMSKDRELLEQAHDRSFRQICQVLEQGKIGAFLTIGDPSIYSTYQYIQRRVLEQGGKAVMISGIPSFCAAAAALGISLGDNKDEIHIIPGSYQVKDTMELTGTRIYMKSGKKLEKLRQALLESGRIEELEIYAASNCGMPGECIRRGISALEEDSGYLTLVIVKDKRESKEI